MRETKFRAKIPENLATLFFTFTDLIENKFSNREILWPWLAAGNQPDQFTGLHDINGKEIYEGDIVKGARKLKPKKVIFSEGAYMLTKCSVSEKPRATRECLTGRTVQFDQLCVVGNIYENPELLK